MTVLFAGVAHAEAGLTLSGDIVQGSARTLQVPVTATCDDAGQDSAFIDLAIIQEQGKRYVEGQGAVTDVTCDSLPHEYTIAVPITFGQGTWRTGGASLTGILSYCFVASDGSPYCVTQAFIPSATAVTITRP